MSLHQISQVFFALIAFSTALPTAFAQDPRYGRERDGRAYRIDSNGIRLVDELAELQVANDDLRRQVANLEGELSKCGQGMGPNNAQREDRPVAHKQDVPECDELVSNLYLRLANLQQQLSERNAMPAAATLNKDSADEGKYANEGKYQLQIAQLKQQIDERDNLLQQMRSEQALAVEQLRNKHSLNLQGAQDPLRIEIKNLSEQLQREQQAKAQAVEERERVSQQLARVEAEALLAKSETERAKTESKQLQDELVIVSQQQAKRARLAPEPVGNASQVAAKDQFRPQLANIQELILRRKSLYDQLKARNSAVLISMQRLETKSGRSLDSLRREIGRINESSDTAEIARGLSEITQVLDEDIKVLGRLAAN